MNTPENGSHRRRIAAKERHVVINIKAPPVPYSDDQIEICSRQSMVH